MGSKNSKIPQDLKDQPDLILDKKAILITLTPNYILNDHEIVYNLDTGSESLNHTIHYKLNDIIVEIKKILGELFQLKTLACIYEKHKFHITLEKFDQTIFDLNDCSIIRQSILKYNQYDQAIMIMSEDEANLSMYDDLGPIKLGLNIDQIDFI